MEQSARNVYTIVIPEFKTHIQQSANKYKKINGQTIYSSAHHRVRHVFMEQIHEYLKYYIRPSKETMFTSAVELHLEVHAPINYGNVRRIKGRISWSPAKEGYVPTWDLDNFAWIWIKGIQDVLQKQNILPEDTIEYIRRVSYEYFPVDDLKDRKLIVSLIEPPVEIKSRWNKLFKRKNEK